LIGSERNGGGRNVVRNIDDDVDVNVAKRKVKRFDLAADALDGFRNRCTASGAAFANEPLRPSTV
jgi:hypothetical protein